MLVKKSILALVAGFVILASIAAIIIWSMSEDEEVSDKALPVGAEIAIYRNVPVYQNGEVVAQSHGKHYSEDGYYYGQKWQCVEYVKRFYYDAFDHRMPSVWGHAADFFDPKIPHGEINPARGMLQYQNGDNTPPKANDLLVFRHNKYGHVAIVTKVSDRHIEVVQQNVYGHPTSEYSIVKIDGKYTVGGKNKPAGWLRLP